MQLSYNKLQTFGECALKYRFAYIERLPRSADCRPRLPSPPPCRAGKIPFLRQTRRPRPRRRTPRRLRSNLGDRPQPRRAGNQRPTRKAKLSSAAIVRPKTRSSASPPIWNIPSRSRSAPIPSPARLIASTLPTATPTAAWTTSSTASCRRKTRRRRAVSFRSTICSLRKDWASRSPMSVSIICGTGSSRPPVGIGLRCGRRWHGLTQRQRRSIRRNSGSRGEGAGCRTCAFQSQCPAKTGEARAAQGVWQQGSLLWEMTGDTQAAAVTAPPVKRASLARTFRQLTFRGHHGLTWYPRN